MKTTGKHILEKFTKRWQLLLATEVLCYTLGVSLLVYGITSSLLLTILTTVITLLVSAYLIKPWGPNLKRSSSFIDESLDSVEYSTGLFLEPTENLSNLAKLQRLHIAETIESQLKKLTPPHQITKSLGIAAVCISLGFLAYQFNLKSYFPNSVSNSKASETIHFQATDSTNQETVIPVIENQTVSINYPNYTSIATNASPEMDIKAVEGSVATWNLTFNTPITSVAMESMGNSYPMSFVDGNYTSEIPLGNSGFYSFKFEALDGAVYTSDLYSIEVIKDKGPRIEMKSLDQFTSFNYDELKVIQLNANVSDDFGIDDAFIVATVSKGTGESVKFREEKLSFGNQVKRGYKLQNLRKTIDLDQMDMEPGDELYFYVQASDLKQPKANVSRSETYFAVIKDTTTNTFAVEGTLGVDRMPDYFRSQRQLIIDTEKLIKAKKTFTKDIFKYKSNELGFDQKALRLKYAEFMGEETEESTVGQEDLSEFEAELEHEEEGTDDPLEKYSHKHDSENEHNLVDEKKKKEDGKSKNPLSEYTHDHSDPESASLFEESLKTKLRKALNAMWDSELQLRLYKPEASLPYQYTALKHIQDIKNSARIYVHRIGFDPPPIKEDKRLTGKLDKISSYRKTESLIPDETFPFMRKAIQQLEAYITGTPIQHETELKLFSQAGNELAQLAIENPGKHLQTLQSLKSLSEGQLEGVENYISLQKGLILALPQAAPNPNKSNIQMDDLNLLLLKALEIND